MAKNAGLQRSKREELNALKEFLDDFFAPGLTTLRKQRLPALQQKWPPEPLQFAGTTLLQHIENKTRARAFNFILRTKNAYEEYQSAKRAYNNYFKNRIDVESYL